MTLSNNSQTIEVGTAPQEVPFDFNVTTTNEKASIAEEIGDDGGITGTIVDPGSARNDHETGSRVEERHPGNVMTTLVGLQSDGVFGTMVGFL